MEEEVRERRSLAVALKYDDTMAAPQVVATGKGEVAKRILALAKEHGVPFVQDAALAEALGALPLAAEIPEELYAAVAAILAYLYRLDRDAGRIG